MNSQVQRESHDPAVLQNRESTQSVAYHSPLGKIGMEEPITIAVSIVHLKCGHLAIFLAVIVPSKLYSPANQSCTIENTRSERWPTKLELADCQLDVEMMCNFAVDLMWGIGRAIEQRDRRDFSRFRRLTESPNIQVV